MVKPTAFNDRQPTQEWEYVQLLSQCAEHFGSGWFTISLLQSAVDDSHITNERLRRRMQALRESSKGLLNLIEWLNSLCGFELHGLALISHGDDPIWRVAARR